MKINDILVPIDFSPVSLQALDFALQLAGPKGELCLLHVVDAAFVERAAHEKLADAEILSQEMTDRAQARLDQLAGEKGRKQLKLKTAVTIGRPFQEVLRLARELAFQAIVMGTHGRNAETIEQVLFGSTTERVLRGANVPVICVPYQPER